MIEGEPINWPLVGLLVFCSFAVPAIFTLFGPVERCTHLDNGGYQCIYYLWHVPW